MSDECDENNGTPRGRGSGSFARGAPVELHEAHLVPAEAGQGAVDFVADERRRPAALLAADKAQLAVHLHRVAAVARAEELPDDGLCGAAAAALCLFERKKRVRCAVRGSAVGIGSVREVCAWLTKASGAAPEGP